METAKRSIKRQIVCCVYCTACVWSVHRHVFIKPLFKYRDKVLFNIKWAIPNKWTQTKVQNMIKLWPMKHKWVWYVFGSVCLMHAHELVCRISAAYCMSALSQDYSSHLFLTGVLFQLVSISSPTAARQKRLFLTCFFKQVVRAPWKCLGTGT